MEPMQMFNSHFSLVTNADVFIYYPENLKIKQTA
jgi:hypothetical protein